MGSRFTRKRVFKLHGWLGLNLGWLLFAVCLSGTIAVFTPELDRLLDSVRNIVPSGDGQPASWEQWQNAVEMSYPGAAILYMERALSDRETPVVATVRCGPGDLRRVFIDPYSSVVLGQRSQLDLKSFVRIFHKQFYLVKSEIGFHGTLLVGWFGLLLLVSALTGLYAFKRWWRALYTIRFNRGARVFWSDLHRSLGTWALLVAIVVSVTGLWYLVEKNLEALGLAEHDAAPVKLVGHPPGQLLEPPGSSPVSRILSPNCR